MEPNPETLFHLIPKNAMARNALLQSDNTQRVSRSSESSGCPGLEIGFHVQNQPLGTVICRLGTDTDLLLPEVPESDREHPMSSKHVQFEVNPTTEVVMLVVRAKLGESVRVSPDQTMDSVADEDDQESDGLHGDCAIFYGQSYTVWICSYKFTLRWVSKSPEELKSIALKGCQASIEAARRLPSRSQPTGYHRPDLPSFHLTRTVKGGNLPVIDEIVEKRKHLVDGRFGKVYQTMDRKDAAPMVVKIIKLSKHPENNRDYLRTAIHREITVMEQLQHDNIIKYLGHAAFHTDQPRIYMLLKEGNLAKLASEVGHEGHNQLCDRVLFQMLQALDYLASKGFCHRDVKPENILYNRRGDGDLYDFQLADFGFANVATKAGTFVGTDPYLAPELWPREDRPMPRQTPKVDVWSLLVTIAATHHSTTHLLPDSNQPSFIFRAIDKTLERSPALEPMSRKNPDLRASAAQMLVVMFNKMGLTTPIAEVGVIPEREPPSTDEPNPNPLPTETRHLRSRMVVYPRPPDDPRHELANDPQQGVSMGRGRVRGRGGGRGGVRRRSRSHRRSRRRSRRLAVAASLEAEKTRGMSLTGHGNG